MVLQSGLLSIFKLIEVKCKIIPLLVLAELQQNRCHFVKMSICFARMRTIFSEVISQRHFLNPDKTSLELIKYILYNYYTTYMKTN